MRMLPTRCLPIMLILTAIPWTAAEAQRLARPVLEFGLEPLMARDYPSGTQQDLRSFSPGYRVGLGLWVGTPQSAWTGSVRVTGLWRSYSPSVICVTGGPCAQSLTYRAYGLEAEAQYGLRQTGFIRPYIGGGFGFYATRQTKQTLGGPESLEDQVRPAALATFGFRLGHGATFGPFAEATLIQFATPATKSRLLPLQVGWRF